MSREMVMSLADDIDAMVTAMNPNNAASNFERISSDITDVYRLAALQEIDAQACDDLFDSALALSIYLQKPMYVIARELPDYSLRSTLIEDARIFRVHCELMVLLPHQKTPHAGVSTRHTNR